jgi:E3 ubiquitin-protein ligase CCNP1IP1
MVVDQDSLRRKNEELAQAFREKSRKHLQTQELYDKLKRRAMLGQVQNAASDAVDHTIQASAASNRFMDPEAGGNQHHQQPPLFTDLQAKTREQSRFSNEDGTVPTMPPPAVRGGFNESWNGFSSHESNHRKYTIGSGSLI